jgi:rhodanese-related sulfurtransferase
VYDAERVDEAFEGQVEAEGVLLDDLPDRLDRYHYDLVATTTFHADEAQALVAGAVPVVAMLVGPGFVDLIHEVTELPAGSRVGVVCASARGSDNIAETLVLAGATGVEIVAATPESETDLEMVDRTADLVLMSREAIALGLDDRISGDRVREWLYEFDPSGLELLRRAIEHVQAARRRATVGGETVGAAPRLPPSA